MLQDQVGLESLPRHPAKPQIKRACASRHGALRECQKSSTKLGVDRGSAGNQDRLTHAANRPIGLNSEEHSGRVVEVGPSRCRRKGDQVTRKVRRQSLRDELASPENQVRLVSADEMVETRGFFVTEDEIGQDQCTLFELDQGRTR